MSTVVSDLVARVRSEGVQETAAQVKAVGDQAAVTARALEIMAGQFAKLHGGTAADALTMFSKAGVQPTAAALAEAAKAAEKTGAAVQASVPHLQAAARATEDVSKGWTASESSLVRFGAGLLGVSLGISLVAGAARLVHQTISDIITTQLDWERSLKNLSGLYGETGARAAALADAQANLPGVLGTNQEFAQAAINASALTQRYGLSQRVVDQLTTTGGQLAFATGMTNAADRARLHGQLLEAVQSGAQLPQYDIYTDPEAVARRLGFQGAQSLQAFTPAEVMQARAAVVSEGGGQFVERANANRRIALEAATAAEKAVEQARSNLTARLEATNASPIVQAVESGITMGGFGIPQGVAGHPRPGYDTTAAFQGNAEAAMRDVVTAQAGYAQSLADITKATEEARQTFVQLAHSADGAGARLISFFGSLEDQTSIAHGDILAQAQGAVTARARSAVPVQGMGATEIAAIATGTAWQQAWQNFAAPLAQQERTNAIRRNLEIQAGTGYAVGAEGPGLDPARRSAARRALDQAPQLEQVNRGIGQATTRAAQVDIQAADTQAKLEAISLTQRERYVQLMRETVDLRRLDVEQQQASLAATMNVVRAQQAALPAAQAMSAANYQSNLANALSLQRMSRLLQGRDVSGLPSFDELIQMNRQGQFAAAEAAPASVTGARRVEVASQTATAAGLAQALTAGQLQSAQLGLDLQNLGDLPAQTALMLQDIENGRSQLSVQTELREYMKQLVYIMTNQPAVSVPADRGDRFESTLRADLRSSGGPR